MVSETLIVERYNNILPKTNKFNISSSPVSDNMFVYTLIVINFQYLVSEKEVLSIRND